MLFNFLKPKILAGTHNYEFHADDLFCGALLQIVFGDKNVKFIRTRDAKQWAKCQILFDVGFEYDPSHGRYDHHQRDFDEKRENEIYYSAFGLMWREYGAKICQSQAIADVVDKILVQNIDALDNGMTIFEPLFQDIHLLTLGRTLFYFNPQWDENYDYDQAYLDTIPIARKILERSIAYATAAIKAQPLIEKWVANREATIVYFEHSVPWHYHVVCNCPQTKFVVFPINKHKFMIYGVPHTLVSFDSRINFPRGWLGLEHADLEKACGVPGSIFCHSKLTIAAHTTQMGATQMVDAALLAAN